MSSQNVKIIAGQWKGRKIRFSDRPDLRPTSARLRETLFNWLAPHIQGARCLDLFAGSGALSWEALSRGASHVTLLETDRRVVKDLVGFSQVLDCEGCVNIQAKDALFCLDHQLAKTQAPGFDIVFVDPPFTQDLFAAILQKIVQLPWVSSDTLVYLEVPSKADFAWLEPRWKTIKYTVVGDVQAFLLSVV